MGNAITVSDGIDIRIILNITSEVTLDASDVYTDQGEIVQENLQLAFDTQRQEIETIVEELAWTNVVDNTTSEVDPQFAFIFQPESREDFRRKSNLTTDETDYNRVAVYVTTTQLPTTMLPWGVWGSAEMHKINLILLAILAVFVV